MFCLQIYDITDNYFNTEVKEADDFRQFASYSFTISFYKQSFYRVES